METGKIASPKHPFNHGKKSRKNRNFKGKKDNLQKDGQGEERNEKYYGEHPNDISFYGADRTLIEDSARVSFNDPLGTAIRGFIPMSSIGSNEWSQESLPFAVPGILRLSYIPQYGMCDGYESALNTSSRKFYAYLRHTLSTSLGDMDPTDVMNYVIAADNVVMFWTYLATCYGVLNYYSAVNKYTARALCTAMGFNYANMTSELANFKFNLDLWREQINRQLKLPLGFGFVNQHFWMTSHLWRDSDTDAGAKTQVYLFHLAGVYRYDHDDEGKGKLTMKPTNDLSTLTKIRNFMNNLLNGVLNDADMQHIGGVILRAQGDSGIVQLPECPNDHCVVPEYSEEALEMIHNSNACGFNPTTLLSNGTFDITQVIPDDANYSPYLYSLPTFTASMARPKSGDDVNPRYFFSVADFTQKGTMLDLMAASPEPERVFLSTRFLSSWKCSANMGENPYSNGTYNAVLNSVGLVLILQYSIYHYDSEDDNALMAYTFGSTAESEDDAAPRLLGHLSAFDWAPRLTYFLTDDVSEDLDHPTLITGINASAGHPVWDTTFYAQLPGSVLANMNLAAAFGASDVQIVARAYGK